MRRNGNRRGRACDAAPTTDARSNNSAIRPLDVGVGRRETRTAFHAGVGRVKNDKLRAGQIRASLKREAPTGAEKLVGAMTVFKALVERLARTPRRSS
jgi:hypothetical protein